VHGLAAVAEKRHRRHVSAGLVTASSTCFVPMAKLGWEKIVRRSALMVGDVWSAASVNTWKRSRVGFICDRTFAAPAVSACEDGT
jgi:hypothetical protein